MAGLIEEIQRGAVDSDIPVHVLLRMVKLAAAKLQLNALESWMDLELNGYNQDLPVYRKQAGNLVAFNSFNGWIPVQFDDPEMSEPFRTANISQPISTLEDMLSEQFRGQLHWPLSAEAIKFLNTGSSHKYAQIGINLSRGCIVQIVDAVRNMILDWSIEMERQGVVGHEFSFSSNEKNQAVLGMTKFNIGSIGQFIGNLGEGNSSGSIGGDQTHMATSLFAEIREVVQREVTEQEERHAVISAIDDLESAENDKGAFRAAYTKFVEIVANHMTAFAPFMPRLAQLLA